MVSLDDLLISKPEDLNIDQLLASESMAGEEEEQTKTLQPHLSKQDVKSLVCKQKSTLTYFHTYIKQSLEYVFFVSQFYLILWDICQCRAGSILSSRISSVVFSKGFVAI